MLYPERFTNEDNRINCSIKKTKSNDWNTIYLIVHYNSSAILWQTITFLGMVCIPGPFKRSHHPLAETDQRCALGLMWISEKTEGLSLYTLALFVEYLFKWVFQLCVHAGQKCFLKNAYFLLSVSLRSLTYCKIINWWRCIWQCW